MKSWLLADDSNTSRNKATNMYYIRQYGVRTSA